MATVYAQDADEYGSETCSELQHDLLASLAIAKGLCVALDSSFNDFLTGFKVTDEAGLLSASSSRDLTKVESDCRFCLSRLLDSLERLEAQLAEVPTASATGSAGSPDNPG